MLHEKNTVTKSNIKNTMYILKLTKILLPTELELKLTKNLCSTMRTESNFQDTNKLFKQDLKTQFWGILPG